MKSQACRRKEPSQDLNLDLLAVGKSPVIHYILKYRKKYFWWFQNILITWFLNQLAVVGSIKLTIKLNFFKIFNTRKALLKVFRFVKSPFNELLISQL